MLCLLNSTIPAGRTKARSELNTGVDGQDRARENGTQTATPIMGSSWTSASAPAGRFSLLIILIWASIRGAFTIVTPIISRTTTTWHASISVSYTHLRAHETRH